MNENEKLPQAAGKIKPVRRIMGVVVALITAASVGGCQAMPPSSY